MFKKKNEDDLYRASKDTYNKKKESSFLHTNQKEEENTFKIDTTSEEVVNNNVSSYSNNKIDDKKENKPTRSNTFIPYLDKGETKGTSFKLAKIGKVVFIGIGIIISILAIYTIVIIGVLFYCFDEGETRHYDESEVQSKITAQSYTNFTIFNVSGEKIMDIACQDYNESYANLFINDKGISTTDIYISDQQLKKLRAEILANPTNPLIIKENNADMQVRFLLQTNVNGGMNDNVAIDTSLSSEVMQMIVSETPWGAEMDSFIDLDSLGYKNNVYTFVSYENDEYLLIGVELK